MVQTRELRVDNLTTPRHRECAAGQLSGLFYITGQLGEYQLSLVEMLILSEGNTLLRLDIFSYCESHRKWINVQTSDETLRPRTVEYLVPRLKSLVHLHHTADFPHKPETGEEANCTCK